MIAGIYARKSTKDEAGVERQVEIATDFITAKGWTVGPAYTDDDISGAVLDRRGLNALLAAVEAKAVGAVVMMNVDRLSRGTIAETLELQQRILRAGVQLWYYQTGARVMLTTATDELKGAIDAYGARDFRDQIKAKTTQALRKKAAQGHATGARTYGYRGVPQGVGLGTHGLDKHTHVLFEIDPAQAAVVRRIFEMAAAGHGDLRIADALDADGVPAPRSSWSKDAIRRALRNELYVGVQRYGVKTATDDAPMIRVSAPHLRIISDEVWEAVQARKQQTKAHYLRTPDGKLLSKPESGLVSRWILNGLAKCHQCGGSLAVMGHATAKTRYYFCQQRYGRGRAFCSNGKGIPAAALEEAVRSALFDLLAKNPDVVAALVEERDQRLRSEQASQGDRRAEALKEAAELEKQIANLVAALANGAASPDVTQAINERRAKVESLKATPAPPPPFDRAAFFRRFEGVRKIAMLLEPSWPSQMRQAIRKLGINAITVAPDGMTWTFEGVADIGPLLDMGAPEVARIPGDQVNMHVEDALTGRRTDVDPDIVAIGLELAG